MKKTCTPSAHKALSLNIFNNDDICAGAMPGQDGAFAVGHIALA